MKENNNKKWTGKRKALLACICLLLGAGLLVGFVGGGMGNGGSRPSGSDASTTVQTVTLKTGDIRSTVSATGTIYSTNAVNVYSNLSYSVKSVYVSVGDTVAEGDILAELDTESLESSIAQKQAQVSSSQSTAQQNLKVAQQDLEDYQNDLENNLNTNLMSAEKSVSSAQADLAAAELEVESANIDLNTARRNYRDAKDGEDDTEYTDSQLRDKLNTVSQKEIALEKAQNTLARRQEDLENAKANLEAVKNSSNETLRTYQDKVSSAQLNNNFNSDYISIQSLQSDLDKCVVTATASGTITTVNAIEGGSGNGLLFVIQNTNELNVITNIKEYNIGSVNVGDRVIIKTDATGDTEFEGTLTKIAPTSTLTASGGTTTSTDAEFEAEVTVDQGMEGLLIGMNARLSIVTGEKSGVFSVPFEAVETADGNKYVYVLHTGESGDTYERIAVETGLETNLYIEISSDSLAEGMQVAKTASGVSAQAVGSQPGAADILAEDSAPEGAVPPANNEIPAETDDMISIGGEVSQ